MGIKWTIVDGPHIINANKNVNRYELLYRPHNVEHDGQRIIVIPRDREVSIAQQSGYDPVWLKNQIEKWVQPHNSGDFLLTVATDGENGWFRHSGEKAGFWGWFFDPLSNLLERDADFKFIELITIDDYLDEHPPEDTVSVEDGCWNVPDAPDDGRFLKWTGGEQRQKVWAQILETSRMIHDVNDKVKALGHNCPPEAKEANQRAWRWLLLAESSDNFWWGSQDWLDRSTFCSSKAGETANELSRLCGFT
jgi:alpha-amylase/alpha-mannosidase (GH57 family)